MAPPPLIHASRWNPAKFLPCLPFRAPAASPRGRRITTAGGSLLLPVAAAAVTVHRRCNAFPSPTAAALSAVRPLTSPATPRAFRVRAASARLLSPFTRAPPSLRFTQRVCQQLSSPHLFPLPSPSLLNSSRRTSRVSRSGRVLRPGRALALLAPLLAAIGVSFAAVLSALPAALTAVFAALPAALTAVSAATTAVASNATVSSVALPLLQILAGVGGAVGVVTLGLIWTVLDRLFCLILLLNFAAGLLSIARDSYRLIHARRRSLQDPTLVTIWAAERDERDAYDGISEGMAASVRIFFLDTGDPRFDWFVPGVVSLIPGVNGAAWMLASWHSSPFLSRGLKRHLALNAAVYGLPGLASLLIFALGVPSPTSLLLSPFSSLASAILAPFSQSAAATAAGSAAAAAAAAGGGVAVVGYGSSSAWWVSVVLGAVQLQLERVRAVSMQESRQVLRAFGRGLKRTRERRLGQRKWMEWGMEEEEEEEEEAETEEDGRSREGMGQYGEDVRPGAVNAAMGGASRGGRAGDAGKDGNARRGSSGNSSSSSSSSRGGGDMWMEAEERRRLQEFDAKLMGRPLQQMGPPAAWTTGDVATWLTAEGFACYAQAFLRHAVCGQVLLELTVEDLRDDLGVRTLGDRKRLLSAIAQLRLWPEATATSLTPSACISSSSSGACPSRRVLSPVVPPRHMSSETSVVLLGRRHVGLGGYGRTDPLLNKPFYPNGLVVGILTWYQSEGLGFESQCVHFGYPSAGGCQRSTGDPRLILGKGYRHVGLGGYGRTDPLLNKPFYPNAPPWSARSARRSRPSSRCPVLGVFLVVRITSPPLFHFVLTPNRPIPPVVLVNVGRSYFIPRSAIVMAVLRPILLDVIAVFFVAIVAVFFVTVVPVTARTGGGGRCSFLARILRHGHTDVINGRVNSPVVIHLYVRASQSAPSKGAEPLLYEASPRRVQPSRCHRAASSVLEASMRC
ncbi:unnamed protein product [Closterium sp. NIES-54]